MAIKLFEKDANEDYRLICEVPSENLKRAKLKSDPIYVLKNTIDDAKETVLFVYRNKKGKKVYRARRTDVIFDLRKNGNFADSLNEETREKLGIVSK